MISSTKIYIMKKILSLLIALVVTATVFAQVSVTIDNVTTETRGKFKGDLVTFTISAQGYDVWGTGVDVVIGGEKNGGGGLWNPHVASNTTGTYSVWVGLMPASLNKERIYTVMVAYSPLPGTPYDPNDPYYVISDPYTVAK
jgi:hypothetical protein